MELTLGEGVPQPNWLSGNGQLLGSFGTGTVLSSKVCSSQVRGGNSLNDTYDTFSVSEKEQL